MKRYVRVLFICQRGVKRMGCSPEEILSGERGYRDYEIFNYV